MLTALLLILAQNQEPNSEVWVRPPRVERIQRAGGRSGPNFAFFEAFPVGGAGTRGVCSTTAPTGAKGETLTFTRGSNGTCTRTASGGLATTGIANGDLVVLSSNQPRVSYDANGTLGLLVESSRTNTLLRSEEIDNAAWAKTGAVVAAPTVTANFAVAPDGATTAERVQFAATDASGLQASYVVQGVVAVASNPFGSVFVRGNGTSGTIDVCQQSSGQSCTACAYVSGSWSRCFAPACAATTCNLYIGNMSLAAYNGGVARAANDVLVWGGDLEPGTYATSYIPTVAATVTRSAEAPSFGPSTFGITANSACVAASVQRTTGTAQAAPWLLQNVYEGVYTGTFTNFHYPAGSFFGTLAMPGSGVARLLTRADGVTRTNCVNGTCESTAVAATNFSGTPWTFVVGNEAGSKFVDSIITRIQVDPSPLRCTP